MSFLSKVYALTATNFPFLSFHDWLKEYSGEIDILMSEHEQQRWYETRIKNVTKMLDKVKTSNGITAYRCMKVPQKFIDELKSGKTKRVGTCWTIDKELAPNMCNGIDARHKDIDNIILKAEIPFDQLDLTKILDPSWGDGEYDEMEINPKKYVLIQEILDGLGKKSLFSFTPALKVSV